MGLRKRVYNDKETIITADNLNDIQDAILVLEDGLFSVDNDKSGEVITITDAANRGFRSLRIFGKTTQDGTPTLHIPAYIHSLGDGDRIIVTVNGENEAQRMTIAPPNNLHGIPVTDGGNYTDENGQQWVCDEIDLARGVYVQRIKEVECDGTERWVFINIYNGLYRYQCDIDDAIKVGTSSMFRVISDALPTISVTEWTDVTNECIALHFADNTLSVFVDYETVDNWKYYLENNPMTIIYQLATPIETPLPEEELAAYAALRTYKNNTTVSNDVSAHMELEYAMDAKKYIESILGGASSARLGSVTLKSSAWKTNADGLHSQVVTIAGVTPYSKVDLLPSVEQLAVFHNKDVAFVTENEDGVVTVFAIGDKPTMDYTMQVSITEVTV